MNEPIKDFIDSEKEALKILKQKIKKIDTVMGINTVKDFQGRQLAIKIINEWLTELWNIAYPELPEPEEDDDIFRTIINSKVNS
jgi:hypothetical protein